MESITTQEVGANVLCFAEAESLIKSLNLPTFTNIGSKEWQRYHEYIEKLNLQALLCASSQDHEFINELITSHGKLELLVKDLLQTEVWKSNVFPIIKRTDFQPESTIPLYMALYHEATIVNLLETLFYHQDTIHCADDVCLDLLDFCYRKLAHVTKVAHVTHIKKDESGEINNMKELSEQAKEMDFEISVKCVSILRYLTDALDSLPLSVSTRMMKTLNIPYLLVELIQNPPWIRRKDGKMQKFIDGNWKDVVGGDLMKITKVEAQSWLALYNLMSPKFAAKYHFSDFNKSQIIKLRANLNDVIIDQLPILIDFRRFLEELAISQAPPPQNDLVLEQLPEIRDKILKENRGKYEAIAKHQMIKFFNPTKKQIKEQAKRLAQTYDYDVMDALITEVPHCSNCQNEATKRCSRCRREWYCSRECQVSHWKKHKSICDVYIK